MTTNSVDLVIDPPVRDLGDGFQVRRALPTPAKRTVGPFVFFDQMGPTALRAGRALDVRPHPHIGLATVTYLFEGEILHRDSLGTVQLIQPGAVNWMTAGRGIVHSERSPAETRQTDRSLFGIQMWVALPRAFEETEASFVHCPAASLPLIDEGPVQLRVIVGELYGIRSPVRALSEMFYADAVLKTGAQLALSPDHEERALYVVEGVLRIDGVDYRPGQLLVLRVGVAATVEATASSRLLLFGGARLPEPRYLWWNFVSSSRERLMQAAEDWRAGRFERVPGETEFIPLPDTPLPVAYP